jgi:hypothetical protein
MDMRAEASYAARWKTEGTSGEKTVTEAEWLGCTDPKLMLIYLRFKCGVRKLRLFTAACLRRDIWHRSDIPIRIAIESVEQLAEDRERIAAQGLREAHMDAEAARATAHEAVRSLHTSGAAQAALLRDICGPLPFRAVAISPVILAWNDSVVVRLAQTAYNERQLPEGTLDNGRLAVLADALEEAGCTDADILGHLRGPGPHVRGCWPVDLCLRKS